MTNITPSTSRATFAIGNEQTAKRIVDLLNESFFEGQAAIAAFEGPDGRWNITMHFAEAPDQAKVRELVRIAAGDEVAQDISFDTVEAKDWVKATLEELVPVGAGRFIVHGHHDRAKVSPNKLNIEIEAALAFGTGHHGTTHGCLLLLDHVLKARRPKRVLERAFILEEVWGYDFPTTANSLEVYVGYVRRKTEAEGESRLLHTVRGVGYVLRETPP